MEIRRAGVSLAVSFYIAMTFLIAAAALPLMDRYETRVFPVVRDFVVTRREETAEGVLLSGEMRKVRDCRFMEVVFYVGDISDPQTQREMLYVTFADRGTSQPTSREPGHQPWGPWLVRSPTTAAGPDVFMRVTHRCHSLYDSHGVYLRASRTAIFGEPGHP
jgi:hypothetical protein